MTAVVVLGMHRSGTSAIAGMLAAARVASTGQAIRNWDNARGHHEMLELVRLDEAVLAHSGGHYLSPPPQVRWTDEHAAIRDRLLGSEIDGLPALLKDPRMLLVLPFWRASAIPVRTIGVIRHPLAVARSLAAWRELPLDDGIALWLAHDRALAADHATQGYPIVDFEQPQRELVATVAAFSGADAGVLDAAFAPELVHHDAGGAASVSGLDDAVALYRQLVGPSTPADRGFPRDLLADFVRLLELDPAGALVPARAAVAAIADASAVVVPAVTALVRVGGFELATRLIDDVTPRLDPGLAALLRAKVLLAQRQVALALPYLEAACALPDAYYQARHLLPQALREVGRHDEARAALLRVAGDALYPHNPLSTLAEWSWLDGERDRALAEIAAAIEAAPLRRRGRLRERHAAMLRAVGQLDAARAEIELGVVEDPGFR